MAAADMEVEIANATDAEMSVTSRGIARTTAEEMMTKPTIVSRSKFYFAPTNHSILKMYIFSPQIWP